MVKLFKPKLPVESAMRMVLGAALRRDSDAALAELAQGSNLSSDDIAAIARELQTFELAVWHLLFLRLAAKLGAQELTKRFTISLMFACKDADKDPEQGPFELEAMMSTVLDYLEAAGQRESGDAGLGFLYCQEFTDRILPQANSRPESGQDRHLQVFDIARQSLRVAEAALADLQKEYRIVTQ